MASVMSETVTGTELGMGQSPGAGIRTGMGWGKGQGLGMGTGIQPWMGLGMGTGQGQALGMGKGLGGGGENLEWPNLLTIFSLSVDPDCVNVVLRKFRTEDG